MNKNKVAKKELFGHMVYVDKKYEFLLDFISSKSPQNMLLVSRKAGLFSSTGEATLHRLICYLEHGPPPPGFHCDHINFNRFDNRAENLQWLSPEANCSKMPPWHRPFFNVERGKHMQTELYKRKFSKRCASEWYSKHLYLLEDANGALHTVQPDTHISDIKYNIGWPRGCAELVQFLTFGASKKQGFTLLPTVDTIPCAMQAMKLALDSAALSDTFSKYERIVFAGTGKNALVAKLASDTLASLGFKALALQHNDMMHGSLGYLQEGDAVLHLSRSGLTEEMLEASKHIAAKGISQFLIRCSTGKSIAKYAYIPNKNIIVLPFMCGLELNLVSPTTSTACLTTFCMVLCDALQKDSIDVFKSNHPGGLGARHTNC